jgi:hypothetical protein
MNPLLFPLISTVVDKIGSLFPSDKEKNAAKVMLMQAEQAGELEAVRVQLSAILAESQSTDPWTSRARPYFMYVIYILILMAVPMGFLSAHNPAMALAVAGGFKAWLLAIPDSLYTLFGVGYLGYTGARSIEKIKHKS